MITRLTDGIPDPSRPRPSSPTLALVQDDAHSSAPLTVRSPDPLGVTDEGPRYDGAFGAFLRSERLNRTLNVAIAGIALLLLAPLMLLVALVIRLTSAGPIFHVQVRVGLDRRGARRGAGAYDRRAHDIGGRAFQIYKFRSMYVDAEQRTGAVWALQGDPRITPIGRFIRKVRIDELPQLLNVIKGDMNIVGPRPERPTLFRELSGAIREYPLRQQARPGITGWAQINQAYDTCLDDVRSKVAYDLEYLSKRDAAHDLYIMARTLPVMLFRKGGW